MDPIKILTSKYGTSKVLDPILRNFKTVPVRFW